MRNKIFTALAATLGICVLLNGATHYNFINTAKIQKAYLFSRKNAICFAHEMQRNRNLKLIEASKETGGGPIADYLIGKRIREDQAQIKELNSKGVNEKTLPLIYAYYKDAVALAQQHRLATDVVYDYAYFLRTQKEYIEAMRMAQWLEQYYDASPAADENKKAELYNLLGMLHRFENRFSVAEKYYSKAIGIWETLAKRQPTEIIYELSLAKCRNNLGTLKRISGQYPKAEKLYRKAFEARQKVMQENPDSADCKRDLADSYRTMGELYRMFDRYEESEAAFKKANVLLNELTEKYPTVTEYQNRLGYSYCGLANLYREREKFLKAETYYYMANGCWGTLANQNPAYKLDLAYGYYCMAPNYNDMFDKKEAEKLYRRAARIQEEVIKTHSVAFLDMLCNIGNLSILAGWLNSDKRNTGEETRALAIHRYLTEETATVYIRDLANSYSELSIVLWQRLNYRDAEQTAKKALALYKLLSKGNDTLYEKDLAYTYYELGVMCWKHDRHMEAEPFLLNALKLYTKLQPANEEAYDKRIETISTILNDVRRYLEEV